MYRKAIVFILTLVLSLLVLSATACQPAETAVVVTRVVTSVAQVVVEEPTEVVIIEVTATPLPTAVPSATPAPTATEALPYASDPVELAGHTDLLNSVTFSPDSRLVIAASDDGTAQIWDTDGNLRMTLSGHTDRVLHAAFSPDGSQIVTSSADKTARLWRVGGELLHVLEGHSGPVNEALFTPDGRFIITLAREPKIWDTSGNLLATLEGHRSAQVRGWLSQNGRFLLTTSGDAASYLWEIDDAGLAAMRMDLSTAVTDGHILRNAYFLPDNERFITNSLSFMLWGIAPTGEIVQLVDSGFPIDFEDVFFDGDTLILLENDRFGTVALRDITDPDVQVYFSGHTSAIVNAVFSPNKDMVLTSSNDHTARLWNLEGETLLVFAEHDLPVVTALFSPDGNFVITGDRNGIVYLWDISN